MVRGQDSCPAATGQNRGPPIGELPFAEAGLHWRDLARDSAVHAASIRNPTGETKETRDRLADGETMETRNKGQETRVKGQ